MIRTPCCEDIDVPADVAADRPDGFVLLNEELGHLLFLPYRGEVMAGFALAECEELLPPVTLPRDEDPGMRIAADWMIEGGGFVYLTERSLMRFGEDLLLIWRADGDFGRWEIDSVSHREIVLVSLDGRGRCEYQARSLDDGRTRNVFRETSCERFVSSLSRAITSRMKGAHYRG
jgi:hypothetical protein